MLAALLLALAAKAPDFDALARARNVDGLLSVSGPAVKALDKPFNFLKVNGPYDTGRFGWRAVPLTTPDGERCIVFSTKITSEDYGEFVFATDGSTLTRLIPEEDSLGFRIEHQKLDIRFDIPKKTAYFVSEAAFRRTGPSRKGFLIRMSPHYRISKAADSRGNHVPYRQAGGVVWFAAPTADRFKYTVTYSGVVDLPFYAGSITSKEVLLTNDYWQPMIARLPQTYEATIHVPKGWTAVAQGELIKDTQGANDRVMAYRMDLPCVYWSLSAAPFKTYSQTINGRKYAVWSPRLSDEQMKMQGELYAPLIEFYSKVFSPYPFSTWGAVDSPQYGGGALEAYSFATYGGGLPAEDPHETAHTWWGGIINNTYMKSLWNESFAVFSDGLCRREMDLGNREERRLAFVSDASPDRSYASVPLAKSGAFVGPVSASLGYGKGAKVLQTLEVELGTEPMIRAMRHWIEVHPKGEPGEWEDFEKAASASVGRSLKTFFDEWARRPGWADFDVENVRWEAGKVLGEAVFKGDPYHLTCEVMLQGPDGSRRFEKVRLDPSGNRASFSILAPAKPSLVSFDPWRKLLRRYEGSEVPTQLDRFLQAATRFDGPGSSGWLRNVRTRSSTEALPANLDGVLLVGHPSSVPAMKPLCERAGFRVDGQKLTFDGTTIDLSKECALAVVELSEGGRCAIGLGTTRRAPNPGRARLGLFDSLGRMLRGKTDPKTTGFLVVRL